jgi:hypothetical protein
MSCRMVMNEALSRVRCLHKFGRPGTSGAAFSHKTARRRTQKRSGVESQQAGSQAQAEIQEASRLGLGPRFRVLKLVQSLFACFAGDFGKGQTLPDDLRSQCVEAVTIGHADPMVEPKGLLIHIAEQVEGFDADVRSAKSALQEAPEVFQTVSVDIPLHVGLRMIDELMDVIAAQSKIGIRFIGEQMRAQFDVVLDRNIEASPTAIFQNGDAHLTAALQYRVDGNLADSTTSLALHDALLAIMVHVAHLPTDEGLIDFNFPVQLAAGALVLHGKPNALKHEPSSLLADSNSAMNFIARNAVLAVGKLPHGEQPLVEGDRRIFKDRADLDGKLGLRVAGLALPKPTGFQEANLVRSAGRADDFAVLPSPSGQIANAVLWIREINDCFLECFRFGYHDESSIIQVA